MKTERAVALTNAALFWLTLINKKRSIQRPQTVPKAFPDYDKEYLDFVLGVWQRAVETQMHFNEMSVKSRQLGLTFVAAALGLAVFLFSRSASDARFSFHITLDGAKWSVHVAEIVVLSAAAAVYAVKQLDLGVYHKMLRGAVYFGEDIESRHLLPILDVPKGMTQAISHFSRFEDASRVQGRHAQPEYSGHKYKTASQKISRFYWIVITFLVFATLAMFCIDNFGG